MRVSEVVEVEMSDQKTAHQADTRCDIRHEAWRKKARAIWLRLQRINVQGPELICFINVLPCDSYLTILHKMNLRQVT